LTQKHTYKKTNQKDFDVAAYIGENKERTPVDRTARNLNLVARGASLPTTGAVAGGLVAGPIGALAGSFILPVAEGLGGILNYGMEGLNYLDKKAGTDYISDTIRSNPRKLVNQGLDKIFPKPETTFERGLVVGGEAVGNVGGTTKALTGLTNTAKNIYREKYCRSNVIKPSKTNSGSRASRACCSNCNGKNRQSISRDGCWISS